MSADLRVLLSTLDPVLQPGTYVFTSTADRGALALDDVVALVREAEGLSLVVPEARARELALPVLFRAAWITLTVHSALDALGLTAAFAAALGDARISCNVVAGAYHDHLFVSAERAQDALDVLRALQRAARESASK